MAELQQQVADKNTAQKDMSTTVAEKETQLEEETRKNTANEAKLDESQQEVRSGSGQVATELVMRSCSA